MNEYYFQCYPTMKVVYAETPYAAWLKYKEQNPQDDRHYFYTGNAYRRFVISGMANAWEK